MTDKTRPLPTVESPCVLICSIDQASGHCHGCGRTVDEIMAWGTSDDDTKRAVLAEVPARLAAIPKHERRTTKRQRLRNR